MLSHGLLGTVASLLDATTRLETEWPSLGDTERDVLLDAVHTHASWIADALEGLVRGLPPDVAAALDRQVHIADLAKPRHSAGNG